MTTPLLLTSQFNKKKGWGWEWKGQDVDVCDVYVMASERVLPAVSCLRAAGRRRQARHAVP